MANGMILRGEVYWVSVDDSVGGEIQTGRPAVIVSGDRSNEKSSTVVAAFVTSQGNFHPHNVSIVINGAAHRVKCDQLRTVSKERLGRHMGVLTKSELTRVTGALATALCIPIRPIESTPKEQENTEITALKAECEMWKRSYDTVMNQLVELKVNSDLALRLARAGYGYEEPEESEEPEEAEVEEPEQPKVVEEPVVEPEPEIVEEPQSVVEEPVKVEVKVEAEEPPVLEKVNINTATITELMEGLDIGRFYASKISAHRSKNGKFVALEELKMVEGLAKNFYERYADLCTIGTEEQTVEEPEETHEPVDGKVNVNTASAQEISEITGMSLNTCFAITGKRKRDGLFKSLDELIIPKRISEAQLNKVRHLLTVGEEEEEEESEPEPKPESEKVNVNLASLRELMAVGFEKRAAALIVNERKKYGRFRSVDDLAEIPEVSGKILRKLRDKLEV